MHIRIFVFVLEMQPVCACVYVHLLYVCILTYVPGYLYVHTYTACKYVHELHIRTYVYVCKYIGVLIQTVSCTKVNVL